MQLDVQTLSVVTVFVTALLGALLVFAGLQNRAVRAPMVWGAAYIVSALGLAFLTTRGTAPNWLSIDIANALVLLGSSLTWAGARMFDARPVRTGLVVSASVLWLIAYSVPAFAADVNLRVVLFSAMMAMLAAVTAEDFWRGRAEPLMSRWPTVCALLGYAAALLARIPAILLSPVLAEQSLMSSVSFALLAFGTLLFTVVLAFLLLNMTKERTELQHKIASLIDPLSGVPNRRAFLDGFKRTLAEQALDSEPLAVFLFDLDRFKAINDEFGHGTGDSVLQIFATPQRVRSAPTFCSPASAARNSPPCCRWGYRRGRCDCRPGAAQFRHCGQPAWRGRNNADRQRWRYTGLDPRQPTRANCWPPRTMRSIAPRQMAVTGWNVRARNRAGRPGGCCR